MAGILENLYNIENSEEKIAIYENLEILVKFS